MEGRSTNVIVWREDFQNKENIRRRKKQTE